MLTRGLKRRAEKEAIRAEKESVREASRMEDTIRRILPSLEDHYFCCDKGGYYSNWLTEPPITSKQVLRKTFEHIAEIAKDPEMKKAFSWAANFESNPQAKEFVRNLSPEAFDKLNP